MKKTAKVQSLLEVFEKFSTEEKAVLWLEEIRWKGNPTCSKCSGTKDITASRSKKFSYWCKHCRVYFTVKTKTMMHASNIPTSKWAIAIYILVTARKSISSLQLSKELGITQKSSWFMCQRIRQAFDIDTGLLSGIVEIDETYIGGLEKNKHSNKKTKHNQGRSTKTKTAVVGMRSRGGKVTAKVMKKVNSKNMQKYLDGNIEKGTTISTDEAKFYRPVEGYQKLVVNHSVRQFVNGMASTNGIESVWAVLKRGYHGTFHHFSRKHMDRYVNEFVFRMNGGNCGIDTSDRMDNVVSNMKDTRLTYKELIA